MKRKYNLLYDNQYDRLLIAGKTDSDIMIGSVRVLNVILDFNSKKEVVNAELLHASEYLTSLNLNPNILDKITDGRLSFRQLRNGVNYYGTPVPLEEAGQAIKDIREIINKLKLKYLKEFL